MFVIDYFQDGETAMSMAGTHGVVEVVQLLLTNGANVNNKDDVCV